MVRKPTGVTGPISMGPEGPKWRTVAFPEAKAAVELMVAQAFVSMPVTQYVLMESQPSLRPFRNLTQNREDDLDFTVETADGTKLLELAEFAPLQAFGPTFTEAPRKVHPREKLPLLLDLIRAKSVKQGGSDRVLLIYNTEQAFWVDPLTVELARRELNENPPRFDRIYTASPKPDGTCTASEVYPAVPHFSLSGRDANAGHYTTPHPLDGLILRSFSWSQQARFYGDYRATYRWITPSAEVFGRSTQPTSRVR